MNKGLIMEKLLEDLEIFDENHLYNRLRKRENLNDSDLALIVSDLIIEQKEQINSNSLVTLINLLKLIINNNCLAKYTISTIYEKINNSLQKEGSKESYLLLNNLRNYLNCILEVNSNEHQIRTFYERQLNDSKREIKNLKKLISYEQFY